MSINKGLKKFGIFFKGLANKCPFFRSFYCAKI